MGQGCWVDTGGMVEEGGREVEGAGERGGGEAQRERGGEGGRRQMEGVKGKEINVQKESVGKKEK